MNETGKTIAKNASVLMVSQLITWGLTLTLMIFLPRILGAKAVGQFHLANSIWAIAGVFAIFGMDLLLTKEIARDPEKMADIFSIVLLFRSLMFVIGFGFVWLFTRFVNYEAETIQVIFIIGISYFFVLFSGAHRAALQGLERMEYISLADIVGKAVMTIGGLILLFLGQGIIVISAFVIAANIVNYLVQFYFLHKLQPIRFRFSWPMAKWVVRSSVPYFMVGVFAVIYLQLDIVIISLLVNEEVTGWYAAADRLFGTLLFVPSIFITSVFPVLSRMHVTEGQSESMGKLMRKSFDFLTLLSIPMGLGIIAISQPLVVLLFGENLIESGPVLAVMGIVLILTYQNILLGRFIISVDRQNTWTVVMAVATIATIPLDLLLVPWCQNTFGNGAIGGGLSFAITEGGMMVAGLFLLPRGLLSWQNGWTAVRTLLAGLGMMAVVWFLRDAFIAIPIAVGAIVYLLLIVVLRVVPKEDWVLIRDLAQRFLIRLRGRKSKPVGLEG